jgi:hypothetical protein
MPRIYSLAYLTSPISEEIGRPFSVAEMIHTARCDRSLPGEGGIDLEG